MLGLQFWHIIILVLLVVLLFGSRRLPQMGRSLGDSIKGFKEAVTDRVDKQDAEAEAEAKALPPAQPVVQQPELDPRERDTVL